MKRAVTAAAILTACFGTHAYAQWTATNLHPAGADRSEAWSVHNGQVVGTTVINSVWRATMWDNLTEWTDLHPPGSTGNSSAFIVRDGVIGGEARVGGSFNLASIWNGTAESWISLNPPGSVASDIRAISDGQQGGFTVSDTGRAALWSGTPESWVDLHPLGDISSESWVLDIHNGQQVGITVDNDGWWHAAMWTGTAESFVQLSPAGAEEADAVGVHNGTQAGSAKVGGVWRASLWNGTPESWQDIAPAGASYSFLMAIYNGRQSGLAGVSGVERASFWSGTSASWEDLHSVLPGAWGHSRAYSIWDDGTTIYVSGYGHNLATNRFEAILWTRPISEPSCLGDIADDFGLTVGEGGGPDGVVDFGDFAALLGLIGPCDGGTPGCLGDIADDFGLTVGEGGGPDGVVDFGDFAALLGLIGPCP